MTEYDAFQQLQLSIRKAAEACAELSRHRPDQPWRDVATKLEAMRNLVFHLGERSAPLRPQ